MIDPNEAPVRKLMYELFLKHRRKKLEAFEHNRHNRFEPAIRFVLEAKDATLLLAEGNRKKNRDFLKKIGSNLQVAEKSLTVEFKNPWNLLADFNSGPTTILARQRGNPLESNWRRTGILNPFCHLAIRDIRHDSPPAIQTAKSCKNP